FGQRIPQSLTQRYDGLPMMPEDVYAYVEAALQAPPSPDYVSGLEEPEQAPPSPNFVPEPVYPEFLEGLEEMMKDLRNIQLNYPSDRDDDDEEEEEESPKDDVDDQGEDEE
ncbi:hypothetical protein Tco_1411841, partial [Tanacetum coccineum]